MKRILTMLVLCLLVTVMFTSAAEYGTKNISVWYGVNLNINGSAFYPTDVNGKSVPAFIYDGTTYVPIRAISELYGADVEWDGSTDTVYITYTDYETMFHNLWSDYCEVLVDNTVLTIKLNEYEEADNTNNTEYESAITFPLHLFSNDGKTYLGKCVTDEWDKDGIYYRLIGDYSSTVASNSIWNPVGTYGSSVSNQSAFNSLAQKPPIIVDNNGKFVAYLTTNEFISPHWTITELRMFLEANGQ